MADLPLMKEMKKLIAVRQHTAPGKPMDEISSIAADGKLFSLKAQRGKYVVLDFWGTWCSACITGFPKMKQYAKKYEHKVQFVSIAIKNTESDWRAGLKKYDLQWIQLLDKNWEAPDCWMRKYYVMQYPTKKLIDPKGNIVQTYVGESEEFYQALDKLKM